MRVVFAILEAIGMVSAAVSARAQTMIPTTPSACKVFGRIGYYECRITGTMRRLGIRRAAQCVLNPHVANAQPTGSRQRRYRGLYWRRSGGFAVFVHCH
jgi:hypothetical protein